MPAGHKTDPPVFTLYPGKGKEDSFASLFREYYPALCYFARSIIHDEEEAKDIVQDCFVKLWDSPAFTEKPDTAPSFLYTSVRNKCIDLLRKRKVINKAKLYSIVNDDTDFDYFDEVAFAEMMRQIADEIDKLPFRMKQVFTLYYIEGKKYEEIALATGTTPETVKKQKFNALKIIRQKLSSFFTIIMTVF